MRRIVRLYDAWVRTVYPPTHVERFGPPTVEAFECGYGAAGARRFGRLRFAVRAFAETGVSGLRMRLGIGGTERDGEGTMARGGRWIDLGYAWKSLRRQPGFLVAAALILGLGVGASATVYSLVDRVLLRPLPFEDPEELVRVSTTIEAMGWTNIPVAAPLFLDVREEMRGLEAVGAYTISEANLNLGDRPARIGVAGVTPGFLDVLGVGPASGRFLTVDEQLPGAPRVALISSGLASSGFGGEDPVGRTVLLDEVPHTVVGVMPSGFGFPRKDIEAWTNLTLDPALRGNDRARGSHYLTVIGRLADPSSEARTATESRFDTWLFDNVPFYDRGFGFRVEVRPLVQELVAPVRPALVALAGAVLVVLLVAIANVTSLYLFRAEGRRREFAVRAAIGAGAPRIVRQILAESLILAGAAGLVGILLAVWATSALDASIQSVIPDASTLGVGGTVVLFTLGVVGTAAVLLGVLPARTLMNAHPAPVLRSGSTGAAEGGRRWVGRGLVVAEIALSVTLMVAAGLLVRSLDNLLRVEPGFEHGAVATAEMELPEASYPGASDVTGFYDRVVARVAALPGVEAVGLVDRLPLRDEVNRTAVWVEGFVRSAGRLLPSTDFAVVDPGFFDVTGIDVVEGRPLLPTDDAGAPPAMVVSRTFVEQNWPGESGVGKRAALFGQDTATVVGVVAAVQAEDLTSTPRPQVWVSHPQASVYARPGGRARSNMTLLASTERGALALSGEIASIVRELDPTIPLHNTSTLSGVVDGAVARPRFTTRVITAIALLALVLGVTGVYGVLSHAVAQRKREMGVRMALGAEPVGLLRLVLGEGLKLAALGILLGGVGAMLAGRTLSALLFQVESRDPATLVTATALLLAAVVAASAVPAWRAGRVDPVEVLKAD